MLLTLFCLKIFAKLKIFHNAFRAILVTTLLFIGVANRHHRAHLMLHSVWIVNYMSFLHYCTPFIIILMVFTSSFTPDDNPSWISHMTSACETEGTFYSYQVNSDCLWFGHVLGICGTNSYKYSFFLLIISILLECWVQIKLFRHNKLNFGCH